MDTYIHIYIYICIYIEGQYMRGIYEHVREWRVWKYLLFLSRSYYLQSSAARWLEVVNRHRAFPLHCGDPLCATLGAISLPHKPV